MAVYELQTTFCLLLAVYQLPNYHSIEKSNTALAFPAILLAASPQCCSMGHFQDAFKEHFGELRDYLRFIVWILHGFWLKHILSTSKNQTLHWHFPRFTGRVSSMLLYGTFSRCLQGAYWRISRSFKGFCLVIAWIVAQTYF